MKQITLLLPLLLFSLIFNAQLPNNLTTKYKIKKIVATFFTNKITNDTAVVIDKFNDRGLIIHHEQLGDTSKLGRQTFTYQYDYLGRVKNKVSIYANGEVNEVSIFYYYDKNNIRLKDNKTLEYRIKLLNNDVDTIIYDENELMLSKARPIDLTNYFYDEKQHLTKIMYLIREDNTSSIINFALIYDNQGLLVQSSSENEKFVFEYDELKRPIKCTFYQNSVVVVQNRFYYTD